MDASSGSERAIAMDRDSDRGDLMSGGNRGSLAGSYGSERMSSDTEE
jgi:hypothetical protein